MESFFSSFQDLPLFFFKNTHQKAVNVMFCLILHVAKEPWLFLEVQFKDNSSIAESALLSAILPAI